MMSIIARKKSWKKSPSSSKNVSNKTLDKVNQLDLVSTTKWETNNQCNMDSKCSQAMDTMASKCNQVMVSNTDNNNKCNLDSNNNIDLIQKNDIKIHFC